MNGKKRKGLTVDPGASAGLVGTDTKLDYDRARVPHCDEYEVTNSNARFSGIDGEPVPSLGSIKQRI